VSLFRRRKAGRHAAGRNDQPPPRPAPVVIYPPAEPSPPPPPVAPVQHVEPVQYVEPVAVPIRPPVSIPEPPAPVVAAPVVAAPVVPKRAAVRLGFADGSSVEIDDGSGASDALKATASRLLGLIDH
jgi:hypothetical protein